MDREWVERHIRIKREIDKLTEENACSCIPVDKTAEILSVDPRTLRAHLEVMKADGVGGYLDPSEKAFCTKEGIKRIAKRLGLEVK